MHIQLSIPSIIGQIELFIYHVPKWLAWIIVISLLATFLLQIYLLTYVH